MVYTPTEAQVTEMGQMGLPACDLAEETLLLRPAMVWPWSWTSFAKVGHITILPSKNDNNCFLMDWMEELVGSSVDTGSSVLPTKNNCFLMVWSATIHVPHDSSTWATF